MKGGKTLLLVEIGDIFEPDVKTSFLDWVEGWVYDVVSLTLD
jgi:hypothetical protein